MGDQSIDVRETVARIDRNRWLAPLLALVATLGAIAALAPLILRAYGIR